MSLSQALSSSLNRQGDGRISIAVILDRDNGLCPRLVIPGNTSFSIDRKQNRSYRVEGMWRFIAGGRFRRIDR